MEKLVEKKAKESSELYRLVKEVAIGSKRPTRT
jgi:hypothetical protein